MFLPHFFVSSCPVNTFLIYCTGIRCGNQYQYICVSIAGIRWAGTIESWNLYQFVSHLYRNVSQCLTLSHRCLTIIRIVSAFLIYIVFPMCRPQARFRPANRPASRHARRGAVSLFVLTVSPAYLSVIIPRHIPTPSPCVRIVWIATSRIYRLEYRLSW